MSELSDFVVVFDLDDTLYKEIDYVRSGMQHVCHFIETVFGAEIGSTAKSSLLNASDGDALGRLCRQIGLPLQVKDSLLWVYRLHTPEIMLAPPVRESLTLLERECRAIAILTDGRVISQRQKMKALGIDRFPAFISEEWDSVKPEIKRYQAVEEMWPDARYAYVGDNPSKDFLAPNRLGWFTIGVLDNGMNIHEQNLSLLPDEYLPGSWIENVHEIEELLTRKY